jgi:hypothetical protein
MTVSICAFSFVALVAELYIPSALVVIWCAKSINVIIAEAKPITATGSIVPDLLLCIIGIERISNKLQQPLIFEF